ncbi:MAG TPA: hypothetical protein P5121_31925, partial [Caldilineaceae bacterium]|nr:hypothetical protein [Caldilineaceae bacterium]
MSLQVQIQAISKQATGFQRNVYIAFICTFFFGFLIFGGAYAVLVNLLLVRLGFGPEFVGLLNGVGRLSLAVGSVLGALLGKRLSSTSLLKGGFFLFFTGMLLFPLAGYLPESLQRGWFLSTYALSFLMGAIFVVHMNPLMMAATNDAERNPVFSYSAALMTIGGFAGSWFAGGISALLVHQYAFSVDAATPYSWTLFAAAALAIVGVIATLYLNIPVPMDAPSPAKHATAPAGMAAPFPWQIII